MTNNDPISLWIEQLRQGDASAAGNLWNHFLIRLLAFAKHKLNSTTQPVYDEEDAAQGAFHSVCLGITAGRFPNLNDRDSLWKLMLIITAHKISNRHRYDAQLRRDVRRSLPDRVFTDCEVFVSEGEKGFLSREPTPEFAAEFVETCERLFQCLDDPDLRRIASMKMEGYTDQEISDRLKCSRRTVQRRITIIRRHWQRLEEAND